MLELELNLYRPPIPPEGQRLLSTEKVREKAQKIGPTDALAIYRRLPT